MYLLLDIGATYTRIATSDGTKLLTTQTLETLYDFDEAVSAIKETAGILAGYREFKKVVVGVRALDKVNGVLATHPTIHLWEEKPLKLTLEKTFSCPVILENDAALAGLGEAVYGAGKGHSIVAYLTISTGVGGARVVDGHIDKNRMGFSPGYQIILQTKNGGQKVSYLEDYISGTALAKRFGKKPEEIKDARVWNEVAQVLAIALNNTTVYWSPDIIIVGGSVTQSIPFEKLNHYYKKFLDISLPPPVVKSKLEDKAGLYGALACLKTHLHIHILG